MSTEPIKPAMPPKAATPPPDLVIASICTGLFLGPLVLELPHKLGVYQATALIFAGLGLITGLPMPATLRSGKKGPV